jgi:hypothetical protein
MKTLSSKYRTIRLVIPCILFGAFQSCHSDGVKTTEETKAGLQMSSFAGTYHPPRVRSFPSSQTEINGWITSLDEEKMRAHAWDIWESINTKAPNGNPIWENWFSGYELFTATNSLELRDAVKDFENPSQFFHATNAKSNAIAPNERPTSFNRFSPSLARIIYDRGFTSAKVLDSINTAFEVEKTPVVKRNISTSKDSTDEFSFALKPVFQFISGSKPTAVPFWAGISAQTTTDMKNPAPDTWRQCVIVDPTGKLKPGETAVMSCNGEIPKPWPVVALADFYAIKITKAQADSFSVFAATSGDDVGAHNHSDSTSVVDMVKEGNIALLTAMHVTGKEIPNWTWQTFWWSPDTQNPVFGKDRPKGIQKPWNNYNMRTAYYMTAPGTTTQPGEPNIQFNPYLETNLFGTLSSEVGSLDTIQWYGVFSNCMSCHRMASWNNNVYIPNGYINGANPVLFDNKTKTDFLWSIPTRAH